MWRRYDVIRLVGSALMVAGVGSVSLAAGLVVAGLTCMGISVTLEARAAEAKKRQVR